MKLKKIKMMMKIKKKLKMVIKFREDVQKKRFYLGLCPKLWVGGAQES